jgi:radical SAM protein with 4Fe4S-binding SPASM domain
MNRSCPTEVGVLKKTFKKAVKKFRVVVRREKGYRRLEPMYAILFLTFRCTSHCRMCTMWKKETKKDEELSLEEWKEVLDDLQAMGVEIVEFFGGDALLRKDDLVSLIRHATSIGLVSYLPTNSHLMSKALAERFVDAELDNIWFSLDAVGSVHNEVRGVSKAFKKVDQAIHDILRARGDRKRPRINVNCVVTRYNLEQFEEVIDYAHDAGCDSIDLEYVGEITPESIERTQIAGMHPTPFFVASDSSTTALLDAEGAALLKAKVAAIKKREFRPGFKVDTGKLDLMSEAEIVAGHYRNRRCYISRILVTVDPYGNLSGCPQYHNYLIGNVRKKPLTSLWRNEKHLDFLKAQARGEFEICRLCSMGAGRNNTPWHKLQSLYYKMTGGAR